MNNVPKDISGRKTNMLTAIKFSHMNKGGKSVWIFRCDCGKEIEYLANDVKQGNRKSCGCVSRYNKTCNIKGLSKHPICRSYYAMQNRCYDKNDIAYHRYGGRGIAICDEWVTDFSSFYYWSINNGWEVGLEIERIDNNGNYEPSNCKWATNLEQANNTSHTIYITYNGETLSMYEWSLRTGIPKRVIRGRFKANKLSIHDILHNKVYFNMPKSFFKTKMGKQFIS